MAEKLIESLSDSFDPQSYRDEYREDLLSMIERKAEGKEIVATSSEEPVPTKAPDLMAALEESIAAVRGEDLGKGASKGNGGGKAKKPASRSSKAKATGSKSSGSKASGSKSKSTRSKSSGGSRSKAKSRS